MAIAYIIIYTHNALLQDVQLSRVTYVYEQVYNDDDDDDDDDDNDDNNNNTVKYR